MVASLWGPAYKGLGGYFRKMGELIISPANYPFMIGAVSSFALIASVPVTDKDIKESSQRTVRGHIHAPASLPASQPASSGPLCHRRLALAFSMAARFGRFPCLPLIVFVSCCMVWCAEFSNRDEIMAEKKRRTGSYH